MPWHLPDRKGPLNLKGRGSSHQIRSDVRPHQELSPVGYPILPNQKGRVGGTQLRWGLTSLGRDKETRSVGLQIVLEALPYIGTTTYLHRPRMASRVLESSWKMPSWQGVQHPRKQGPLSA